MRRIQFEKRKTIASVTTTLPRSYASTAVDWDAERKEEENNSLNQAHASLETEQIQRLLNQLVGLEDADTES